MLELPSICILFVKLVKEMNSKSVICDKAMKKYSIFRYTMPNNWATGVWVICLKVTTAFVENFLKCCEICIRKIKLHWMSIGGRRFGKIFYAGIFEHKKKSKNDNIAGIWKIMIIINECLWIKNDKIVPKIWKEFAPAPDVSVSANRNLERTWLLIIKSLFSFLHLKNHLIQNPPHNH